MTNLIVFVEKNLNFAGTCTKKCWNRVRKKLWKLTSDPFYTLLLPLGLSKPLYFLNCLVIWFSKMWVSKTPRGSAISFFKYLCRHNTVWNRPPPILTFLTKVIFLVKLNILKPLSDLCVNLWQNQCITGFNCEIWQIWRSITRFWSFFHKFDEILGKKVVKIEFFELN